MTVTLKAPAYAHSICAPCSKSAAHRALIAAAFAKGETTLLMRTSCEDIDATVRCLTALGVGITTFEGGLRVVPITPDRVCKNALLDCGESGSTLRFLLPICGVIGANATFMRHGRLPQRPLEPLATLLRSHGMDLEEKGALLVTEGRIAADDYTIAANVSSQYVSGLLFALSLLDEPSTLTLTGTVESAPYIDMTVEALAAFGAAPQKDGNGVYHMRGKQSAPLLSPNTLTVEGDFSGAAFPLAMGAIGAHPITVKGLSSASRQGDRAILALLRAFGADVSETEDGVTVSPAPLHGIDIDARQIPDLVPILAVVAAAAMGTTHITGAERLRLKESDRLASVTAFLRTVGGDIEETDDGLIIRGGHSLHGGTVDACGDHRIAMSAAAASLLTHEAIVIPGAECVKKSYPDFFEEVLLSGQEKE